MARIRVLSLDGGGTHAGVLARTVGAIYGADTPGREIVRQFEFVAGNSGGSIVLSALCCNYTPGQVAALYDSPQVLEHLFSPRWFARLPFLRWLPLRYSSEGKFAALKEFLDRNQQPGEPPPSTIAMKDWPRILGADVNLLVTAFDVDRDRAAFFRSDLHSAAHGTSPPLDVTLAEAAHASCNPPILYYASPARVGGRRYWDGALAGYNNPALAAVTEALLNRPGRDDDIRVLSIGTWMHLLPLSATPHPPIETGEAHLGLLASIVKAAGVILRDPPDVATFHAHVALRQPVHANGECAVGNVVRLCPVIRPEWDAGTGQWTLPRGLSPGEFSAAVRMGLDVMRRRDLDLIAKVVSLWQTNDVPNQCIRMGEHFACDIGHDRFTDAVAHWRAISA